MRPAKFIKNYKKIICLNLIIYLLVAFLSGCWDSKDIHEKTIAMAIAFDIKDGEICYYIEMPNIDAKSASGDATQQGEAYSWIVGKGKTIPEAREDLNRQLHKTAYFNGVSTLILSEEFAEQYLLEYLYRFRATEHYRKKGIIVITKEDPEDLFDMMHEKKHSLAVTIEDLITTLDEDGYSFSRTSLRLLENLTSEYTGILLPCVGKENDEIALLGYSVVKTNRVSGYIPVEESKGLIFLKGEGMKGVYIITYKDNKLTIKVELNNQSKKVYYDEKKIKFEINFDFSGEIMYGDKKLPYDLEEKATGDVKKLLEQKIKEDIDKEIKKAQNEFECDYFQLDDEFRIHYPVEFEKMDWEKEFLKAEINTEINVSLSSTWMMDYGTYELK